MVTYGGTNKYSFIKERFKLISAIVYTRNNIFPTLILLSDGYDNYSNTISNFKNLLSKNKEQILKYHLIFILLDRSIKINEWIM